MSKKKKLFAMQINHARGYFKKPGVHYLKRTKLKTEGVARRKKEGTEILLKSKGKVIFNNSFKENSILGLRHYMALENLSRRVVGQLNVYRSDWERLAVDEGMAVKEQMYFNRCIDLSNHLVN